MAGSEHRDSLAALHGPGKPPKLGQRAQKRCGSVRASPSRKAIRTAIAGANGFLRHQGTFQRCLRASEKKKRCWGAPPVDIDRRAKGVKFCPVRASAAGRTGFPGIDSLLPHPGTVALSATAGQATQWNPAQITSFHPVSRVTIHGAECQRRAVSKNRFLVRSTDAEAG